MRFPPLPRVNQYPYTNFHDLNADWITETVTEYCEKVDQLESNLREIVSELIDTDLQEFKAEIDADINQRFSEIEQQITNDLNAIEADIDAFKQNTNRTISNMQNELTTAIRDINNEIINFEYSVNEDLADLSQHMSELDEEVRLIGEDLDQRFNILAVQLIAEMQDQIDELIAQIPDLTNIYVTDPVTKQLVKVQVALDNIYNSLNDTIVMSADAFTIGEYLSLGLTIEQCLKYKYSIKDWLFRAKKAIVNHLPADKARLFVPEGLIERNLFKGNYCYPIENILINHKLANAGLMLCQDIIDTSVTCYELTQMSVVEWLTAGNRLVYEQRNV